MSVQTLYEAMRPFCLSGNVTYHELSDGLTILISKGITSRIKEVITDGEFPDLLNTRIRPKERIFPFGKYQIPIVHIEKLGWDVRNIEAYPLRSYLNYHLCEITPFTSDIETRIMNLMRFSTVMEPTNTQPDEICIDFLTILHMTDSPDITSIDFVYRGENGGVLTLVK